MSEYLAIKILDIILMNRRIIRVYLLRKDFYDIQLKG
jgi:hypothetical protein